MEGEDPLRAELPARRCEAADRHAEAAERRIAELDDLVAHPQARLRATPTSPPMAFFDGDDAPAPGRAGDGSDLRALPLELGATAAVAAMVTLLALANDNLVSGFGAVMLAVTVVLAWAAVGTRVRRAEVSISGGVVYAEQGGTSYRFDLRSDATQVEMVGSPGDSSWQMRFLRRHLEPFVVDAAMVEPRSFVAQVREHRPAL